MARFTAVTVGMVALLALALIVGGPWAVLALTYITVFAYFMDKVTALAAADRPDAEFPAGDALSVFLAVVHLPLLYGAVWVISARPDVATLDKLLIFLALSLFAGQVSNSNAHELIHRADRRLRRLGVGVYCSILYGQHVSAHLRVHHIHAATDRDPSSARLGEPFYHFAWRAWRGELIEGLRAESRLRGASGQNQRHPYMTYALGSLISLAIAAFLGGAGGLLTLLGIAAYAQFQLLLSDYVQHYGLRRKTLPQGKPEPVGPQHSWNAPQGFSSALMLNAPRHSDHHARPSRAYPGLEMDRDAMPVLPHSLPVMAVLALAPPLWRKVMDRRAKQWAEPRAN